MAGMVTNPECAYNPECLHNVDFRNRMFSHLAAAILNLILALIFTAKNRGRRS